MNHNFNYNLEILSDNKIDYLNEWILVDKNIKNKNICICNKVITNCNILFNKVNYNFIVVGCGCLKKFNYNFKKNDNLFFYNFIINKHNNNQYIQILDIFKYSLDILMKFKKIFKKYIDNNISTLTSVDILKLLKKLNLLNNDNFKDIIIKLNNKLDMIYKNNKKAVNNQIKSYYFKINKFLNILNKIINNDNYKLNKLLFIKLKINNQIINNDIKKYINNKNKYLEEIRYKFKKLKKFCDCLKPKLTINCNKYLFCLICSKIRKKIK